MIGDDPRDSSIPASTVKQLAMLRRLDRASYESQLLRERAAVDRQVAAERRTRENKERRATRWLANAGLSDTDIAEVASVMKEHKVDQFQAATTIGLRRAGPK